MRAASSNAGVAASALQNRGLQVRFLPGLLSAKSKNDLALSLFPLATA
jgi:hypothetical protein